MADTGGHKCKHLACSCVVEEDKKYCSEYCEDAAKAGVMEIACGCEHAACMI